MSTQSSPLSMKEFVLKYMVFIEELQYQEDEQRKYDIELSDDFECNGRACGNMGCCLGWTECEVENVRLFDTY